MKNSQIPTPRLELHEPPRPCSYLPDQTAALEYRIYQTLSAGEYGELLRRGWRRMGTHFFRPQCPRCTRCRSLRVDVEAFRPTKSQKRCLPRNADVRVVVQRPSVSADQIALYDAYHADMHQRRGWPEKSITPEEYFEGFLKGGWAFSYETRYFDQDRLIGVGLIDVVPDALSSIYFYHDPAWRPRGPGTFSILQEIELAKQLNRRWLYLGYWIAECPSMTYKNQYGPHEILEEYVEDGEEPVWQRPTDTGA